MAYNQIRQSLPQTTYTMSYPIQNQLDIQSMGPLTHQMPRREPFRLYDASTATTNNNTSLLKQPDFQGTNRTGSRLFHQEYSNPSHMQLRYNQSPIDSSNNYSSMRTDDIEGAQWKIKSRYTTRNTNPLAPVYMLPSYEQSVEEPMKFIKDPLNIDDIEGTRTKPIDHTKQRTIIDHCNEIDGSRARPRFIRKDGVDYSLNVKDINKQGVFETKRHTNPLAPAYNISTQNRELEYN